MNGLTSLLLAQSGPDDPRDYLARIWTEMQPWLEEQQSYIGGVVATVIGLIVLYIVLRRLAPVLSRRKEVARLFLTIAEAQHLAPAEIALLRAIADHARLENPAILFVRPSLIDRYLAEAVPPGTPDASAISSALAALREKLYGEARSR